MGKDIKKRKSRLKDIKEISRTKNLLRKIRSPNKKTKAQVQDGIDTQQDSSISNEASAIDSISHGTSEVALQAVASAKNIRKKAIKIRASHKQQSKVMDEEGDTVKEDTHVPQESNNRSSKPTCEAKESVVLSDEQTNNSLIKTKENYNSSSKQERSLKKRATISNEQQSPTNQVSSKKIKTRENIKNIHQFKGTSALPTSQHITAPSSKMATISKTSEKGVLKKIVSSIKSTLKASVKTVKSITLLLSLGASTFVFIIIIICTASIIISSPFSIFFSNDTESEDTSLQHAIVEVNKEYNKKVRKVREAHKNIYQTSTIIDNDKNKRMRDVWKDVLLVYTIRTYSSKNESMYFDEARIAQLEEVFFQLISIEGTVVTKEEKRFLTIHVNVKSYEEIAFSSNEEKIKSDLLDGKNDYLWNNILDGISIGNGSIVETALSQVGNIGGEPFWSWYGFNSRVEWCACFISWLAEQNGLIEADVIPKFASVHNEGMPWFKDKNQWESASYEPVAGDIIFFDWDGDEHGDHVGLVEQSSDGVVYTIEGNSLGDECRQRDYPVDSPYILGYGIPNY